MQYGFFKNKTFPPAIYVVAALSFFVTLILYLPAIGNGFVNWDDSKYVYLNTHIRSIDTSFFRWAFLSFYSYNWHPLTWISHAVDYAFWGLNPAGHHAASIFFHCINTFLVTVVVAKLMESARNRHGEGNKGIRTETHAHNPPTGARIYNRTTLTAAFVAGLLFGIHPLHVESVAWVSERKDVLAACFFLLSIMSYLKYRSYKSYKTYFFSLLFFILALMSKPMAVSLPFVLLIIDWYPLSRIRNAGPGTIIIEKIPFFIFSLISSLITIFAQRSGEVVLSDVVPLYSRVLVAFKAFMVYLYKMVWPSPLVAYYPYDRNLKKISLLSGEYLSAVILVVAVYLAAIFYMKRNKAWLAGCLYYGVTLLPVIGLVQAGPMIMADRYTYLPSISFCMLAGAGIVFLYNKISVKGVRYISAGLIAFTLAASIFVIFSYITTKQVRVWRDSISLWSHVIRHMPGDPKAYVNRSYAYYKADMLDEALSDSTEAIRIGMTIFDGNISESFYARALFLNGAGRYEKAYEDFSQAIRLSIQPRARYFKGRGDVLVKLGREREAMEDYSRVTGVKFRD